MNKSKGLKDFLNIDIRTLLFCLVALFAAGGSAAALQDQSTKSAVNILIDGIVLSADGKPVSNAKVQLRRENPQGLEEAITDAKGKFSFSIIGSTSYSLTAENAGRRSSVVRLAPATKIVGPKIELVLDKSDASAEIQKPQTIEAMQFADQPNFTVAGVTDFTAVGGHGSDSTLRTSEALAVETSNLRADARAGSSATAAADTVASREAEDRLKIDVAREPGSFEKNHALGEFYLHAGRYSEAVRWLQSAYGIKRGDRDNEYDLALARQAVGDPKHSKQYVQELMTGEQSAELYRLAGELDESLGDPLNAVREYQKAASLDASEQNYFEWGSELLLHRAIWQAQQVFEEGAKKYSKSARMLTGLGTALFSGAAYDEAAARLCEASDLEPTAAGPYLFMGKIQMAAPNRLDCIAQRLQRFVQQQPGSATANYLYAMALEKGAQGAKAEGSQQPEALLKAAIAIDPKYAEAYLQLGIRYASRGNYGEAAGLYTKAIAADPQLSDAHYRLAVAYDRTRQAAKAKEEFRRHEEIVEQQAAASERERQEVKQFLVVLPGTPSETKAP